MSKLGQMWKFKMASIQHPIWEKLIVLAFTCMIISILSMKLHFRLSNFWIMVKNQTHNFILIYLLGLNTHLRQVVDLPNATLARKLTSTRNFPPRDFSQHDSALHIIEIFCIFLQKDLYIQMQLQWVYTHLTMWNVHLEGGIITW